MPNIDPAWLASLPRDEHIVEASHEGIGFTALLIGAPPGRVRFLVGPLLLEFNAVDVINIAELTLPDHAQQLAAIAVEVVLRASAPLLALDAVEALPLAALGGPLPFSLATRPAALVLPHALQYRAKQTEYLRRHGLEPHQ